LGKAETRKSVKYSDRYRRFGKFQGAEMCNPETLLKNIFIFFDGLSGGMKETCISATEPTAG
jgi:hypothetical protein